MDKYFSQATRAYIYRLAVVIIPVLILAGAITPEWASAILSIVAAVLALGTTGLAVANTPTGDHAA